MLAPDVAFHGTAGDGELRGIDALKRFVAAYRAAFPDACSTVEDQIAEGDSTADDRTVAMDEGRQLHARAGALPLRPRVSERDPVRVSDARVSSIPIV